MQRILTPTRAQDLFGPGKDGFSDGSPQTGEATTQLEALFFNLVQEEISNCIEYAGITLDQTQFDQLWLAINSMITNQVGPALGAYLPLVGGVLAAGPAIFPAPAGNGVLYARGNDGAGRAIVADNVGGGGGGIYAGGLVTANSLTVNTTSLLTGKVTATGPSDFTAGTAAALEIQAAGAGEAALSFHRVGSVATKLGLDALNRFVIGGWSWPAGTLVLDGAGNLSVRGNIASPGTITGAQLTSTGNINAAGTITGGTLNVGTVNATNVTATGTVTGAQLTSTGNITAAGTVTAQQVTSNGNINAAGSIAAAGNLTGAYINSAGQIDASGNINGLNLNAASTVTGAQVTSTGNINAAATITGVNVTATSTVTGAQVTSTGNINAAATIAGALLVSTTDVNVGRNVVFTSAGGTQQRINFQGPVAFTHGGDNRFRWFAAAGQKIMALNTQYFDAALGNALGDLQCLGMVYWRSGVPLETRSSQIAYERGLSDIAQLQPLSDGSGGIGLAPEEARLIIPELFTDADALATEDSETSAADGSADPVPVLLSPNTLMMTFINAFKEIDARLKTIEAALAPS